MIGAHVERLGRHPTEQIDQRMQRVPGAVRIGGMALHPLGLEEEGHRATAADLHHLAHLVRAGGFPHQTDRHRLALIHHPVQKRAGAIATHPLFVSGDGQNHGTFGRRLGHQIDGRRDESGNAGLHVGGAAAPHLAAMDLGTERVMGPGRRIAHRHHIGMAVEPESLGALVAPAREQVRDAVTVDPGAGEARGAQHPLEQLQRAALKRRDRGAADQIGAEFDGIERHRAFLSRLAKA